MPVTFLTNEDKDKFEQDLGELESKVDVGLTELDEDQDEFEQSLAEIEKSVGELKSSVGELDSRVDMLEPRTSKNILSNGGFEKRIFKFTGATDFILTQNIALNTRHLYRLHFSARSDVEDAAIIARAYDFDTNNNRITTFTSLYKEVDVNTEWTDYDICFTADAFDDPVYSYSELNLLWNHDGTIYIGDISLVDCNELGDLRNEYSTESSRYDYLDLTTDYDGCEVTKSGDSFLSIRTEKENYTVYSPYIPVTKGATYTFSLNQRGNCFYYVYMQEWSGEPANKWIKETQFTFYGNSPENGWRTDKLSYTPTDNNTTYLRVVIWTRNGVIFANGVCPELDIKDMTIVETLEGTSVELDLPSGVATNATPGWEPGVGMLTENIENEFVVITGKGGARGQFLPTIAGRTFTFTCVNKANTHFSIYLQAWDKDHKFLSERVLTTRSSKEEWVSTSFSYTPTDDKTAYVTALIYTNRDDITPWVYIKDAYVVFSTDLTNVETSLLDEGTFVFYTLGSGEYTNIPARWTSPGDYITATDENIAELTGWTPGVRTMVARYNTPILFDAQSKAYKLSFKAKASSTYNRLIVEFEEHVNGVGYTKVKKRFDLNTEWRKYEAEFIINEDRHNGYTHTELKLIGYVWAGSSPLIFLDDVCLTELPDENRVTNSELTDVRRHTDAFIERMPYQSGEFGIYLTADQGKSILETVISLPECGFYTVYVNKACPDNPPNELNSSFRGFVHLCNNGSEYDYANAEEYIEGWIVLFDNAGNIYTQYINSGIGSGWKCFKGQ